MLADAPCALCAAPIQDGEAWMANAMNGSVAHAGCVYRDERAPELRERWQPAALADLPQHPSRVSGER
jgi:hypothetical protein